MALPFAIRFSFVDYRHKNAPFKIHKMRLIISGSFYYIRYFFSSWQETSVRNQSNLTKLSFRIFDDFVKLSFNTVFIQNDYIHEASGDKIRQSHYISIRRMFEIEKQKHLRNEHVNSRFNQVKLIRNDIILSMPLPINSIQPRRMS